MLPGVDAAAPQRAAQRDQVGARLLDVDVDRVEPLDHRQRIGLVGGDERADGAQRAADAPADRRGDAGEAQVDPRGVERGAVLRDAGSRLPRLRGGVGIILLGDRLHLGERLDSGWPCLRGIGSVARALATLACGLVDRGLVEARVDLDRAAGPCGRRNPSAK